jgi:cytochrome c biogenesis protein CcdA
MGHEDLQVLQRYLKLTNGFFFLGPGWHGHRFDAGLRYAASPTYLTAIAAGLLSFLSPCVLPLVPAYLGYLSGHSLRNA